VKKRERGVTLDTELDADIAFRIIGRMQVPLYLDQPGPGAHLVYGEDALPTPNPEQPSYDVEFELLIPQSAKTEPAKLLQYGHGLLGSKGQRGTFSQVHERAWLRLFGADLVAAGDGDDVNIINATLREMHQLETMFDRMHQARLSPALDVMMSRRCWGSRVRKYLNPTRYYHGISQADFMVCT
jgi:hypothetical protein